MSLKILPSDSGARKEVIQMSKAMCRIIDFFVEDRILNRSRESDVI